MLRMVLAPGHGQYDNRSPLDASFYVGTNNYLFALVLKEAILAYEGVEVSLTRNNITANPTLAERGNLAVANGADVFLSLHSNAYNNPSVYGVEGYYSINTPEVKGLLQGLCNVVRNNLPNSKVRKVTTKTSGGQDYYGVLRASAGVPYSALIEMGFHTNAKELACIRLDEWHQVVAEQMAKVFSDFFGLKLKEVSANIPEDAPTEETKTEEEAERNLLKWNFLKQLNDAIQKVDEAEEIIIALAKQIQEEV